MKPAPRASPKPILKQQDSTECASPSSYLGLSYTLSPRSTPKSVSIAPHTEVISPLMLGRQKSVDELQLAKERPKKPTVKSPSIHRLSGKQSPSLRPLTPLPDATTTTNDQSAHQGSYPTAQIDRLVEQISGWIKDERAKRSSRPSGAAPKLSILSEGHDPESLDKRPISDDGPDLDRLEEILKQTLIWDRFSPRRTPLALRPRASPRRLHRKASSISSDTDYFEGGEELVPSCDAVLDNSMTLAYTGGASDESDLSSDDELTRVASYRDQSAWTKFKFEIVRLSHTLRLKGWRKVTMEMSNAITVQRLSGALTNAVYVVLPPSNLPPREEREGGAALVAKSRKPPPKLLLRIYGPQVEHLIDRDAELAILRRLARKRIGPRLLGTFANGRFEEFFHAKTLTAEDIRNPDTSRQIAKRMRELHEGIELLEQERDDGAFVWRNWDKWVQRVEQIVCWLDAQVEDLPDTYRPTGAEAWKRRGHICGVPWKQFRKTVEKYRTWLDAQYGGSGRVREQLVFAHNDTQYGNILRLVPTDESPLLMPDNTHKQLVVIDFEYANANLPGLEFANHFTEWCYNYHEIRKPYACKTERYPTPEEQDRFIRAYIRHRPQYNGSTTKLSAHQTPPAGSTTPSEHVGKRSTTSISDFFLDARTPSTVNPQSFDEACQAANEDMDVKRLTHETRVWRLANTAQWVAWGLVQAKVPGMPDFDLAPKTSDLVGDAARQHLGETGEGYRELAEAEQQSGEKPEEEEQEEFDYLGYAQHRAMFFWGDALQLGIVKAEELPDELRERVKTVPY